MSHPPSHRVGDKRRYYYYSGNPRNGGFKRGYSGGSNLPPSTGSGPVNRASRYDPHSPRKPINTSSSTISVPPTAAPMSTQAPTMTTTRMGSRYNPDVGISPSMMDGPLSGGGSRYSGSRYNPQSRPRPLVDAATASSNINSATSYYSRSNKWRMNSMHSNKLDYDSPGAGSGRPPFWKSQKRPPAPIPSRTSLQGLPPQVHASRSNSPVPRQVGSQINSTAPSNVHIPPRPHPQSQLYSHSPSKSAEPIRPGQVKIEASEKKEAPKPGRAPSGVSTQTRTLNSGPSTVSASAPAAAASVSASVSVPSALSAPNVPPSKVEAPTPIPASTTISSSIAAPTLVSASVPAHSVNPSRVETSVPVAKAASTSENPSPVVAKDKQENKKEDASKVQDNPHSLGSSLINSVPQQTRKPEHRDFQSEGEEFDINYTYNKDHHGNNTNHNNNTNPNINNNNENNYDSSNDRRSSNLWSLQRENADATSDKSTPMLEPVFKEDRSRHEDYEYVYDPRVLKQDLNSLESINEKAYAKPLEPLESCIFPMTEKQTRLWELKNQPWDQIISQQHHRLKIPIKDLRAYPFVKQNTIMHKQALKPLLCSCISKLKRNEYLQKLRLKRDAHVVDEQWHNKCKKMDAMSHELRKEEIHRKERQKLEANEREKNEKKLQERQGKPLGSSRRRNRADFVDDAEMENVLLQIDPVYKHIQSAAEIPPMIMNPLERNAFKFKDVNNLVTDKDGWAKRIKQDGRDTFAQHEHDLFVEAYLSFPKKFLKISNYLGGLRTPEECVLHYYRTKSTVDYKKLLNEKNKKRQKSSTFKRNRKRERVSDTDNEGSLSMSEHGDRRKESSGEPIEDEEVRSTKQMEQVEIRVPQDIPAQVQVVSSSSPKTNGSSQQSPSNDKESSIKHEEIEQHVEAPTKDVSISFRKDNNGNSDERQIPQPHEAIANAENASVENSEPTAENALTSSVLSDHGSTLGKVSEFASEDIQQRKRQKHSGDHKSSYWSVKEATFFPDLLKQYGSQWSMISEKLGTKSTTMVRNYYQRNAAQFGWKPLVEEADLKRNATSSGSVQQSQILLQSEHTPLTVSNGVPSQLWPALGFFTNGGENVTNTTNDGGSNQESSSVGPGGEPQPTSLPSQVSNTETAQQPFSTTFNNREPLFPEVPVHATGLPAPRLPSILLPTSTEEGKKEPVSNGSRLKDLLNDDGERRLKIPDPELNRADETNVPPLPTTTTTAPSNPTDHTQLTGAVRPQITNLIVQKLQRTDPTFSNNNRRPSSLSLLLNPDNDRPIAQAPLAAPSAPQKEHQVESSLGPPQSEVVEPSSIIHASQSQIQQQPQQPQQQYMSSGVSSAAPKISFAMDPLGALAAVASESLLETDKNIQ